MGDGGVTSHHSRPQDHTKGPPRTTSLLSKQSQYPHLLALGGGGGGGAGARLPSQSFLESADRFSTVSDDLDWTGYIMLTVS